MRPRYELFAALMMSIALAAFADDSTSAKAPALGRAPDHVLIKFNPRQVARSFGSSARYPASAIAAKLGLPAASELKETSFIKWARRKASPKSREDDSNVDVGSFMYLNLPRGMTPEECVNRLKDNPLVEYVEVDPIGIAGATPTNDPYYGMQWYLAPDDSGGYIGRIHAPDAWDITTGMSNVVVAVLDTGCDSNNLEFTGRVVAGYDIVNNDDDPADDQGHGTAVSAVLSGNADNLSFGAGVDWLCKLMPVKVMQPGPGGAPVGYYSWWAQGINWAVENGAKVINLSAGGWDADPGNTLRNAITNAVAHGIIFITITHNYPASGISYPGSMAEVITVGGSDSNGNRCAFSAYGTNIDLVAPATNIFTVTTGNVWEAWGGTSFAAPQVAGVAALICSLRPELNNEQVRNLLCAGAVDRVGTDTNDVPGFDRYYGWGILNAYNSLVLAGAVFEQIAQTNEADVLLSWRCPSNASNKLPYKLEFVSDAITNAWTAVSNIAYDSITASYLDADPASSPRFYRLKVRGY